jgi:hypothetical protein
MTRALMTIALVLGAWGSALADSWVYPKEVTRKTYDFGKSRIVLEVDATRNWTYPDHTLFIYLDVELMARYRNVAFEQIHASKDNEYFVGLSNRGIPGTAFVIFDAKGNLIREEKHRFLPTAIYTSRSVTLSRVWFDSAKPEVEFKVEPNRLAGILVWGSNKQRYDLLRADLGFNPNAARAEE